MKSLLKLLAGLALLSPVSFAAELTPESSISEEEQQEVNNVWDLCVKLKSRYHAVLDNTEVRNQISDFISSHGVEDLVIPYGGYYGLYHIPEGALPIHVLAACEENDLARMLARKLIDHGINPSLDPDFRETVEKLFEQNYNDQNNVELAIKRIVVTNDIEGVLRDTSVTHEDLLNHVGLLDDYREYLKENFDDAELDELRELALIDSEMDDSEAEELLEDEKDKRVDEKINENIEETYMDMIRGSVILSDTDIAVISAYENNEPLGILNVLLTDEDVWNTFLETLADDLAE